MKGFRKVDINNDGITYEDIEYCINLIKEYTQCNLKTLRFRGNSNTFAIIRRYLQGVKISKFNPNRKKYIKKRGV